MRRQGHYSPQRFVSRVLWVGPNTLLLWHTAGAWGTVQYWPYLETQEHPLAQWPLRMAAGPSRLFVPHRNLRWRKAFLRSLLGWGWGEKQTLRGIPWICSFPSGSVFLWKKVKIQLRILYITIANRGLGNTNAFWLCLKSFKFTSSASPRLSSMKDKPRTGYLGRSFQISCLCSLLGEH